MPSSNAYDWIDQALTTIHKAKWYRQATTFEGAPGATIQQDGRSLLNFASNDYLGLAADPRLADAAIAAIQAHGTGSTGSRLLSGDRPIHRQLERAIADLKQTDDAIVFSSGYLANIGTLAAIVGSRDLVLGDRYNHSCLRLGVAAAGATLMDYEHADPIDLACLLDQHRAKFRRLVIATDSVFSMDGDLCPLPQILELAELYDGMVLVDEAHGTGVLGDRGAGGVEHLGCGDRTLIQMGTLSKALGSLGGYVAGSATLIDFLRNRAPSWIYTTALSPADTGAALAAIEIVRTEPERRAKLRENVDYVRTAIAQLTASVPDRFRLLPSDSPILCLEVSDAATVLRDGQALRDRGIFVSAVRPPTVPTSRLRLTVMATHQRSQLDQLITALEEIAIH
ncbi:MAG: 8-amino-7-oxononanoate synthase [Coleofasciculaceae cyanobacterium RL_1_1]|nr:8-amino-7-oxononanoate synthase [Coleofasciculaceae cyanobacterium RL_1_1]